VGWINPSPPNKTASLWLRWWPPEWREGRHLFWQLSLQILEYRRSLYIRMLSKHCYLPDQIIRNNSLYRRPKSLTMDLDQKSLHHFIWSHTKLNSRASYLWLVANAIVAYTLRWPVAHHCGATKVASMMVQCYTYIIASSMANHSRSTTAESNECGA
jgi:hypothetical protein